MKHPLQLLAIIVAACLAACGGGGGDSGPVGGGNANTHPSQSLPDEINSLFAFTPNQPIDVTYVCGRSNSQLTYYFDFKTDLTFDVYFTTDTHQDVTFSGTYTYQNDVIHITSQSFILPLDETTMSITPRMGLVGLFETQNMACAAYGHGYNDQNANVSASYGCPYINIGPASRDVNAIEFVHHAIPFSLAVDGSIFRQKDVEVSSSMNPIITRGYGIYRRSGDVFYADFGNQFNDHNLLKGSFSNSDQQITVDQLEPSAGPCNRR